MFVSSVLNKDMVTKKYILFSFSFNQVNKKAIEEEAKTNESER